MKNSNRNISFLTSFLCVLSYIYCNMQILTAFFFSIHLNIEFLEKVYDENVVKFSSNLYLKRQVEQAVNRIAAPVLIKQSNQLITL